MEKYEVVKVEERDNDKELADESNAIVDAIVQTNDVDKLNEYINMFNINKTKKNIIRTNELNELLSLINKQAVKRLKEKPDNFSNNDIITFMKATRDALNQTKTTIDDIPPIQINKQVNTININSEELDKDSKAKVYDLLKSIIDDVSKDNDTKDDIIDVTENEVNDKG